MTTPPFRWNPDDTGLDDKPLESDNQRRMRLRPTRVQMVCQIWPSADPCELREWQESRGRTFSARGVPCFYSRWCRWGGLERTARGSGSLAASRPRPISLTPWREFALFPDRLTALASAACNAGARDELHNLGAVHQAAHHAALTLDRYAPERLPESTWSEILTAHSRTN